MGKGNGYQHLKVDAKAAELSNISTFTWMNGNGFYSLSSLTNRKSKIFFTELGANDPNYNLRKQRGLLLRNSQTINNKFLNVYEIHGNYNPASEAVLNSEGSIRNLGLMEGEDEKVIVQIELKDEKHIQLLLDLKFANSATNEMLVNGELISWEGNYKLIK
jgi:hypothetical protein